MRDFIYATDEDFKSLKNILSDGECYTFDDQELPAGCSPEKARIGFEQTDGIYKLYIDKGITTTIKNPYFKQFLADGQANFMSVDDLAAFLRSLKPLFEINENINIEEVVDIDELNKLRSKREVLPEEIERELNKKIFGQEQAISELANKIAINKFGSPDELLPVVILGSTATGKSETSKLLAKVLKKLYNEPYQYLEIAANEFSQSHTIARFFGSPPGYVGYGSPTILEPVRKNPYHVIVINEIEKANEAIITGLMEAIDTGYVDMADNSGKINLNSSILIFTSNLPVDRDKIKDLDSHTKEEVLRDIFTKHTGRPEISGKIGNFITFKDLDDRAKVKVLVKFIDQELARYSLRVGKVEAPLMKDFLEHETKYGARGLRGLVRNAIGKRILIDRSFTKYAGSKVNMYGSVRDIKFEFYNKEDNLCKQEAKVN